MAIGLHFDHNYSVNTFDEVSHFHKALRSNNYMSSKSEEHIDKAFYKGASKNTKLIQGKYLTKVIDEDMEEYYTLFNVFPNRAVGRTVKECIRYYKNYFKLSTPESWSGSAPNLLNHFQTMLSGLEFTNVPIREIVPSPYPYDEVEKTRYMHVHTCGGKTYPVSENTMYAFNYDLTPTNVDQFEPLPKWRVNRKAMNLIRKNFYANTVDKITSMYKLLPEQLTLEEKRSMRDEYKQLDPQDDYAMFLFATYKVNSLYGYQIATKKEPVEKVVEYLENTMKQCKHRQILERV